MKKIILVIDVGNTHTVCGFYQNEELLHKCRFSTDRLRTEDEYFAALQSLVSHQKINLQNVSACALSSVVPNLTRVFTHMSKKYFNCPFIAVNAYTDLGLSFPVEDPGFIGADLIVNAYAAKEKYKQACIICDFGTATTIQLVGDDGTFYGTAIAPGVFTSSTKLFEKASLLSNISLEASEELLGISTKAALLSGIINGNAYMIDGFIKAIKTQFSHIKNIKSIATGGISKLICNATSEIDEVDKDLTLNGLYLIAKKQLSSAHSKVGGQA